ncbi:TadE/TadG family type IV pilus assembly protein [Sphingopyxis sp.]|uniref:TadE/TadG family type IV pilus assembly protein n=1 Tax=Sphingopyxis sp. TaxID=1908224 RepID=UPI003D141A83
MAILRSIIRARKAIGPLGRNLWKNRAGTAVMEFAIVGPAFIALLLAIMYTMLIYLAQQMLETAAEGAGRLVLTGFVQTTKAPNGTVGLSASDFKNAICNGLSGTNPNGEAVSTPALLPPLLSCSRLTVNVTTATSYNVASGASPTFVYDSKGVLVSTGTGYNYQSGGSGKNRIIVLQLIYLWPTGKGPLGLNLIDEPNANRKLVATSVFTTEDYTCDASQSSC